MRNIVLILAAVWALLVLFGFVSRGMPGAETFAILPVMVVRYGPVYGVPLGISVMGWSYAALVLLSLLATGVGLAFRARFWGQVTAASGIVGFLFLCVLGLGQGG